MGWEEEIPPVPTRAQEIEFINKIEENYKNQGLFKFYMSEAPRRTKLRDSEIINQFRKEWTLNFCFGLFINGALLIAVQNSFQRMSTGVPYFHRPKAIFYTPKIYNQSRKNRHLMIQLPALLFLSLWYAHHFTDRSEIDDEYLERNRIVKML